MATVQTYKVGNVGTAGVTRAGLVDTFAGFPARLAEAARGAADRPVAAGEWGPAEIVRHLIAVEDEVWRTRLARLGAEDHPHWPWTEPGLAPGFDGVPLDEVVAAFAAGRAATAGTVRALDEAGWARSGTHDTYGALDVEGLLRIAIDHDAGHLDGLGGSPVDLGTRAGRGDRVDPGATNPG